MTLSLIAGCRSTASNGQSSIDGVWRSLPDLAVSRAPFDHVEVNYKERLDQPYAYVEWRGSYTQTGGLLAPLHEHLLAAGIRPCGPPFALYYDDPGSVPMEQLNSRACFPLDQPVEAAAFWKYDVLPAMTVTYALIGGPYPQVPRAYPSLYAYMTRMGWVESGPVREIYLVAPSDVDDFAELVCEVQIPVRARR